MNTDLDRSIDQALRAALAPPPAAAFALLARRASGRRAPWRRWPWALAAAAALLVGALVLALQPGRPTPRSGVELGALWVAAYEHAMGQGFEGGPCCDLVGDLPQACQERFATQLDIAAGPVRMLGCYCGLPTGGCMTLLVRHDGTPVCVFVLPRTEDPRPALPAGSRYDLARRELGDVVVYALSESVSAATVAEFLVL
ncbi:MAG: hypothetical protein KF830_07290 [Planctomycetes bacterium]|nr:hypothetical protein [Planctomycetota bacterium]